MKETQILLTNDDGIRSPGLWAAAKALSEVGFVNVVAPREQFSGAGRSMPNSSDGIIQIREMTVNGQQWQVYAVGGTPAQTILHAVLEILPQKPDLVVSGINYGENVGSGITISGTVGAAMEAASMDIPALAVSLETDVEYHLSYSEEVDFSAAAHFTKFFSTLLLKKNLPPDVDLLKIDVPCDATVETPWKVTRVSRLRYFIPVPPDRESWLTPARLGYRQEHKRLQDDPNSDTYVLRVLRWVSVTPISLDMTSRVDLTDFEKMLRDG